MMLKCEKTGAGSRLQEQATRLSCPCKLPLPLILLLLLAFFAAGCRDDMQNQPKMKPYRSTKFFPDGLSGRQPIPGTVARGFLRDDTEFFTGKKAGTQSTPAPQQSGDQQAPAQDN